MNTLDDKVPTLDNALDDTLENILDNTLDATLDYTVQETLGKTLGNLIHTCADTDSPKRSSCELHSGLVPIAPLANMCTLPPVSAMLCYRPTVCLYVIAKTNWVYLLSRTAEYQHLHQTSR